MKKESDTKNTKAKKTTAKKKPAVKKKVTATKKATTKKATTSKKPAAKKTTVKKTNNPANKKGKIAAFLTKNKKRLATIFTISVVTIIIGTGIFSTKQREALEEKRANAPKVVTQVSDLTQQIESDIVFGDANAPITIIEYASLSCPHCSNFYNDVFGKIKKKYIDKKKVKFIYRDFPLNQPALLAAVVSKCHAKNNNYDSKKYYKFIKVLFKTQDSWAFDGNPFEKVRSLAKLDNMTSKQFETCVNDQNNVDELMKARKKASDELHIKSTPSFIMNGKMIGGYHNFKDFDKAIKKELDKLN